MGAMVGLRTVKLLRAKLSAVTAVTIALFRWPVLQIGETIADIARSLCRGSRNSGYIGSDNVNK